VNQRFAATNPQFQQFRAPVTVTAQIRYDIGPTRERQVLTQALDRGRRTDGIKANAATIKAQFGNGGVPNPLATILRDQDTLKLSSDQADAIATMNRRYLVRLDSIWSPIATQFAALPDGYEKDRIYCTVCASPRGEHRHSPRLRAAGEDAAHPRAAPALPQFIALALDDRYLKTIRSGTAGGGGGGMLPGGMMGPAAWAAVRRRSSCDNSRVVRASAVQASVVPSFRCSKLPLSDFPLFPASCLMMNRILRTLATAALSMAVAIHSTPSQAPAPPAPPSAKLGAWSRPRATPSAPSRTSVRCPAASCS
jgi:hypothetical protein